MEFIKVSAKTVEDAMIEASIQLETSSDNIEYEVLEQGSTGFLGIIGSKPAVIQAKKKKEFSLDSVKESGKEIKTKEKDSKRNSKKEIKKEVKKENINKSKEIEKEVKKTEKTADKKETMVSADAVSEEKPVKKVVLSDEEKQVVIEKVKKFLSDIFTTMNMKVNINASFDELNNLNIDMTGSDMGILIGKRGQTLDSLQYLTSLIVNKEISGYIRVKLDTENYRTRRKETLENLAKNIASKVKRTRKPVFLEPMNPYERRIIHSTLQKDPYVSTHSEGEEPYRKVVVTLKK